MTMQQYCLRWNNHQPNFISVFSSLLNSESLVDVTLAAEGRHLQAHKVVLSACSSYFQSLFTINPCQHPIVILKDVKFADLKVMVDFMYYGEVNVSQEQLPHILKTAEMLKIKGLAEIPVDQSVARPHNSSGDRAELLTPGDNNWNIEGSRQLSASPCPLSPASKRKRLRKSSTGSGSGSTERTSEEQVSTEVTLTQSSTLLQGTVIKSDQGSYASDGSTTPHKVKQQHSSDSEHIHRGSSHDSVDSDSHHQITLQVPQQQDLNVPQNIEVPSSIDVPGSSASTSSQQSLGVDKPISTTHAQLSQQFLQRSQQMVMGTKRHRFLMRQPRIKRESDSGQIIEGGDGMISSQYLSLPSVKMERQCSDPLPTLSPPPGNLLTVPGATLTKQHSHPLLPSQTYHPVSPPLNIHLIPHPHTQCTDPAERAISPVVVVTEAPTSSPLEFPPRGDSAGMASLRVRTDELKRSASSPQSSTRSSHCPVVRSGPALGCNYCWNTVDTHGRILRRKTKYHCPECQTNLCIVPCFQEYHERHASSGQTDPIALTTSVMKMFPKTSTM